MTDPQVAILMLCLFIVMVMLGFPIAFTLIAMGLGFGYYAYATPDQMENIFDNRIFDLFVQNTFSVMSNDVLVAVPLFLFMGYVVERANIVDRLFFSLQLAARHLPASMAVAALATCAVFATATGIIGALIYQFVLIRIRGMEISEIMASYAIGLAILEGLRWGGFKGMTYTLPAFIEGSVEIAGIPVDYQRLLGYRESQPKFHQSFDEDPAPVWRLGAAANRYIEEDGQDDGRFVYDFTTNLDAFEQPVRFIASGWNEVLGEDFQLEQANDYPYADVRVVPGAGHDLQWVKPAETLRWIRDYLNGLDKWRSPQ